jgi:hypothetical protein
MSRVKHFNKNEAKVPENPCCLPIMLPTEEVGLTEVILEQIVPSDQIFITATAGTTKLAAHAPVELAFRLRKGGIDGQEICRRVRSFSETGENVPVTLTHVEAGLASSEQRYTLTVQMVKGKPGEAKIDKLVSMSGVVYGN